MKQENIQFLESIAQSMDSRHWKSVFEELIDEVRDNVMAEKISVSAGNEACERLRQVLNKITILDTKPVDGSKNPAI